MKFAKKSLGQNFLIDKNIINKIVGLVKIQDKDVIEIGPGKGALTSEILKKKPKSLSLIEKDNFLFKELKIKYKSSEKINLFNDDILKFDLEKINKKGSAIFGNLPYNISSQILVKILNFKKWPPFFNDIVFMFQKEVGEKIIGKFSTDNYGRLSILTNYRIKPIQNFLVSQNCFYPKPKVTSMVIHFKPRKNNQIPIKNLKNLEKVTSLFFSNKRKMINKSLYKLLKRKEIDMLKNLDTSLRPADIEPELYYKIVEIIEKR